LLAAGQREIQLRRRRLAAPPIPVPAEVERRIRRRFPFPFTAAQERAIAEITADLARGSPMARLLEGEVGCGKTAVAIYGLLAAVAAGLQGALLVPTAPLAHQHLRVLARLLEGSRVRTALLVGGLAAADGERIRSGLAGGDVDLVVGTHALIEERVSFRRLGLVVIDEEQRFGVRARSRLVAKGGVPHCLKMTATPIPRSLALVHYGEWDRSIIDELPPGRRPVETRWVPEERREDAWGFLQGEIEKGHRILFVLPRIEEGEEGTASVQEAKTRLERSPLGRFPLAVAHGRLPAAEQLAALEGFRSGEAPVLVATTLIEVGLDVPELTVLWIESAERFGLAQLHQLRGRVGRSGRDSWCFVSGNPSGDLARRRFEVFVRVSDGFRLAEEDLVLRGAGEELGTRQSGRSFFRIEHPLEDLRAFTGCGGGRRRSSRAIRESSSAPPCRGCGPSSSSPGRGPPGGRHGSPCRILRGRYNSCFSRPLHGSLASGAAAAHARLRSRAGALSGEEEHPARAGQDSGIRAPHTRQKSEAAWEVAGRKERDGEAEPSDTSLGRQYRRQRRTRRVDGHRARRRHGPDGARRRGDRAGDRADLREGERRRPLHLQRGGEKAAGVYPEQQQPGASGGARPFL
ncbi:MAG: DEAD/DEAH box helicase, partial [Planctomycetota bacterium]